VIVMAVPMVATLVIYAGGGLWVSIAAGGLLGLCSGGDNSVSIFLARRYFSAETFGRASATQMVAASIGRRHLAPGWPAWCTTAPATTTWP
jgi:hypothetical protein